MAVIFFFLRCVRGGEDAKENGGEGGNEVGRRTDAVRCQRTKSPICI